MEESSVKTKKPFDKKNYRFKKYSKQAKLEDWKKKRETYIQHKYKKMLKKEQRGSEATAPATQTEEGQSGENSAVPKNKSNFGKQKFKHGKTFHKAALAKKEEALKAQEAAEKQRQERQKAVEKRKELKEARFKRLSAKTKRGQPLMGGRIELLLDKITQSMS